MDAINQALAAVGGVLAAILGLLLGLFGGLENWLREQMQAAGVPHQVQTAILIIAGVLFIVAALRLLGGLLRLLVIVFLILLLLHVAIPGAMHGQSVPT